MMTLGDTIVDVLQIFVCVPSVVRLQSLASAEIVHMDVSFADGVCANLELSHGRDKQ